MRIGDGYAYLMAKVRNEEDEGDGGDALEPWGSLENPCLGMERRIMESVEKGRDEQQVLENTSVKRAKSSTSGYSSSSNPSTPINIEEDETINNAYDPMTRPPGRKAEKRKMKQTTINEPTPVADLIQKMMDDKKERDEKKLELLKKKIEQDEKKVILKKIHMEMEIMSMDTSNMFEEQQQYYKDGIYPSWATFVKTIPCPNGPKATNFAAAQESARKDVERAFAVLQARFSIVRGPARFWDRQTLQHIMKACIIMHNLIINAIKVFHPITMHERVNAVTFLCHVTTLRNFRMSFKTTCILFVTREHILNSKPIWWSTCGISKVDMKKLVIDYNIIEASELPTDDAPKKKGVGRGAGFNIEEDRLLIGSWLNTSLDAVHGNEQKLGAFWERVGEYYYNNKQFPNDRTDKMLSQQWQKIQASVNKFCGCLATIISRNQSGTNEQDKQQVLEKTSVKRAKSSTSSYSSSSNPSTPINIEEDETINNAYDPMTRPPGRKAEKRKMKQTTINEPTPVADLIQKMIEDKKERDEKKLELLKQKIEQDKKKVKLKKIQMEMEIMSMDTSNMSEEQQQYYAQKRLEILRGGLDGGF
ncbi:putative nuclease HARBI1 [Cinnamomum micranthum f. kanehirae]|uniref:Putative nuclease HARBI1 n=1 Tax=Cinnamomum micranthum f. kanehirae TaxID=337451 RepID=A0A443N396_9MAGN|nr:putative nuclease HARBI1 [Cinnamomum micranthum f. kanehirae]